MLQCVIVIIRKTCLNPQKIIGEDEMSMVDERDVARNIIR